MALTVIVTNAGRAALVNAANTGTAPVTIAEVGLSATALTPAATATTLPDEFKRLATMSGDVVADDTIHLIVRDEGLDVFTVRSLALYLADGTLFAIYGQADVLVEKSSQSMLLLAIDVNFADVDATDLTFGDANFLNPPATTEQQGVVELTTVAEAQTGIDALRALTPVAAKAAILGWLLAQDGAGSGLDADLLDGQQGSYYTNIIARLGYTPANKAGEAFTGTVTVCAAADHGYVRLYSGDLVNSGYISFWKPDGVRCGYIGYANGSNMIRLESDGGYFNFTGNQPKILNATIWNAGNDGAGSGLDADLLDGQQGSYYLAATTYTAADVKAKLLTVDGSGSGVDADLLDGLHAASFARSDINSTFAVQFTFSQGLATGGPVWFGNSALIASDTGGNFSDLSSSNIDHIWHDETNNAWHFCSDASYRSTGNSKIYGGYFFAGGNTVWHAGNDGAGSGSDADLLDGQQGSYYTNIVARLGYTPLNKAGDTMAGGFVTLAPAAGGAGFRLPHGAAPTAPTNGDFWTTTGGLFGRINGVTQQLVTFSNDGAGSGLDADLLDGQQGSYYLAATTYTAADVLAKILTVDGAGSGLDADMLDGKHASSFVEIASAARPGVTRLYRSDATNGYYIQTRHAGSHWLLEAFTPDDVLHSPVRVGDALNLAGLAPSPDAIGSTIVARASGGDIYGRYGYFTFLNNSHAQATRNSDDIFFSSNDDFVRKNTAAGFWSSLGAAQSLAGNGYEKLPSGRILQWGSAVVSNGATITFPIAFPNNCFLVLPVQVQSTGTNYNASAAPPSLTGFTAYHSHSSAITIGFIAIGN